METRQRRSLTATLALVPLLLLLAAGAGLVRAAVGVSIPAIGLDPSGVVSAFSLRGWDAADRSLRFPDQLRSIDGVSPDGPVNRQFVLAMTARAHARQQPHVNLVFERESRRISVRVPITKVDRYAVVALYLLHAAIAAALFGSALLVLVAAPRGESARAYASVAFSGAAFLVLLLDYHLLGLAAPLFFLLYAVTTAALINFARVYPSPVQSVLARQALIVGSASTLALGVISVIMAVRGQTSRAVVIAVSASNAVALVALALRLLVTFALSDAQRRLRLKSSVVGIIALSLILLVTQALAFQPSIRALQLFAPIAGMLMLLAIAYGLLMHNVFEGRTVVSSAALSTPHVALAIAVACGAAAAVEFAAGRFAVTPPLFVVCAAPIAALTYGRLRQTIDAAVFRSSAVFRPVVASLAQRVAHAGSAEAVENSIRDSLLDSGLYRNVRLKKSTDVDPTHFDTLRSGEFVESDGEDGGREVLAPMLAAGELRSVLVLSPIDRRLLSSDDILLAMTAGSIGGLALQHIEVLRERDAARLAERSAEQVDKSTALGTLAGEVLHELQAPLNFLKSFMSGSLARSPIEAELIDVARDETSRLERLVVAARRMRPPELHRVWLDLAEVVTIAARIVDGRASEQHLFADVSVDPGLRVFADRDRLIQVFVNLLRNAVQAVAGTGARVGIETATAPARADLADSALCIDVWDDGPGVDARIEHQLFQAFRTTRPSGVGLGLVVCARVVRELGWEISYLRAGSRTRFRVSIPADDFTRAADAVPMAARRE